MNSTEIKNHAEKPPIYTRVSGYQNTIDPHAGIGIPLRDWFAGIAMQGWLASYSEDYVHPASDDQHQSVAKLSYIMADAMLAEREQKEEK